MKKYIALVLVLLICVVFVGCEKETTGKATIDEVSTSQSQEKVTEVSITLNAFSLNDIEYVFLIDNRDSIPVEQRINNITFLACPGDIISDVLDNNGYSNLRVDETFDEFLGFIEYKMISESDENGIETITYEKVSDELISVEELMNKEVSDSSVTFLAKWKNLADDYYQAFGY